MDMHALSLQLPAVVLEVLSWAFDAVHFAMAQKILIRIVPA